MFEILESSKPSAVPAGPLISNEDLLKSVEDRVRKVFENSAWHQQSEETFFWYLQRISNLREGGSRPFVQKVLGRPSSNVESTLLLDSLTEPKAPFRFRMGRLWGRIDLAHFNHEAGIVIQTVDDRLLLSSSLFELFQSLSESFTADEMIESLEAKLGDFQIDGTVEAKATEVARKLLEMGLVRAMDGGLPSLSLLDPRPVVFCEFSDFRGEAVDSKISQFHEGVRATVPELFAPVLKIISGVPHSLGECTELIRSAIRLRGRMFDEVHCIFKIQPDDAGEREWIDEVHSARRKFNLTISTFAEVRESASVSMIVSALQEINRKLGASGTLGVVPNLADEFAGQNISASCSVMLLSNLSELGDNFFSPRLRHLTLHSAIVQNRCSQRLVFHYVQGTIQNGCPLCKLHRPDSHKTGSVFQKIAMTRDTALSGESMVGIYGHQTCL
jgi:hypothetical protein